MVAKGLMFNRQSDRTLHNRLLSTTLVKVQINTAIEKNTPLPIPLNDEIVSISNAVGTYVAWPMGLVIVTDVPVCNQYLAIIKL